MMQVYIYIYIYILCTYMYIYIVCKLAQAVLAQVRPQAPTDSTMAAAPHVPAATTAHAGLAATTTPNTTTAGTCSPATSTTATDALIPYMKDRSAKAATAYMATRRGRAIMQAIPSPQTPHLRNTADTPTYCVQMHAMPTISVQTTSSSIATSPTSTTPTTGSKNNGCDVAAPQVPAATTHAGLAATTTPNTTTAGTCSPATSTTATDALVPYVKDRGEAAATATRRGRAAVHATPSPQTPHLRNTADTPTNYAQMHATPMIPVHTTSSSTATSPTSTTPTTESKNDDGDAAAPHAPAATTAHAGLAATTTAGTCSPATSTTATDVLVPYMKDRSEAAATAYMAARRGRAAVNATPSPQTPHLRTTTDMPTNYTQMHATPTIPVQTTSTSTAPTNPYLQQTGGRGSRTTQLAQQRGKKCVGSIGRHGPGAACSSGCTHCSALAATAAAAPITTPASRSRLNTTQTPRPASKCTPRPRTPTTGTLKRTTIPPHNDGQQPRSASAHTTTATARATTHAPATKACSGRRNPHLSLAEVGEADSMATLLQVMAYSEKRALSAALYRRRNNYIRPDRRPAPATTTTSTLTTTSPPTTTPPAPSTYNASNSSDNERRHYP